MGYATWPRLFHRQFVVRRLELAMINPYTKFEVSMFTHYEEVRSRLRSPAVSPFDRAHMTSYLTSRHLIPFSSYSELFVKSRPF